MDKILYFTAAAVLILAVSTFFLSNFRQEYSKDCERLFTEKWLFLDKSVWFCANKTDFILLGPINNYKQISDEETAILFAQNRFPQAKSCKGEVIEDNCCYTVKLACPDYSVSQYFSKYFTSPTATVVYSGSDFTPTLKYSPLKDCGISQVDNKIYASCGSYTIAFEIIDHHINRTSIEVNDPQAALQDLAKVREELFSFLGYDTSNAGEGECVSKISSCGEACTVYECTIGTEWFAIQNTGDKNILRTQWGSLQ